MQHHDAIETLIRQVKTRLKSLEMGAGLAWLLIFVVCFFFVEVVLDHLFALQRGTRLALLAVFKISSLGILALFVIVPLFRRINTFYVAKLIEDSYGAFKSSLISYLELRRSGDAPKEIVELVSRRASECAVETAPETVVNPTRFIQAGYVLLGAMVVFLVYVIVSPKSVGTSLMRAVFPERAILPPTRTSIVEVLPGDKAALEGSDVAVSVKIEGTIPDRADIHWTD
ncbi:MAG: hypothetical protein FJ278_23675, partial [Planctomycetes bacterium]|nr:hypothetical protein [Planctomycetota bacterium]